MIDTFGVSNDGLKKAMELHYRLDIAISKALDSKKPFRAVLEYSPKRRNMAIFTFEEINDDGSIDGQGN